MAKLKDPKELTNRGLIRRCLNTVNDIRVALAIGEGKLDALPKGDMGDIKMCVVARALTNGWEPNVDDSEIWLFSKENIKNADDVEVALKALKFGGIRVLHNSISFETPPDLAELITRFDRRLIPQLILED